MLCLNKFKEGSVEKALFDVSGCGRNAEIKPSRIRYYCENRDPDFDAEMHNVLLVYKQLSFQFDENGELLPFGDGQAAHVLSFDEKPGIQAIAAAPEDLLPDEFVFMPKHGSWFNMIEGFFSKI